MQDEFSLQPNNENHRKIMFITYGLFGLGMIFGGIPTIAGVVLAYVKRSEMTFTFYHDHMNFLIRTFWGGVIGMVLGVILSFIFVGIFVIWAVGIWYIFRIIYGFIKLLDNQSVTTTGWLI